MDKELEYRIQAWLDGELSGKAAAEVVELLDADPALQAHAEALRRIRQALGSAHLADPSVEAAWDAVQARLDQPAPSYGSRMVRFPMALGAVAALLLLSLLIYTPQKDGDGTSPEEPGLDSAVYLVETDLENATPIVYIDQPSGWTVVWVAEQEDSPEKS